MTARRKRTHRPASPLTGRLAHVSIERNGMTVAIADVEAPKVFEVLASMIEAVRMMAKEYPEMLPSHMESVGGYSPVEVPEEGGDEFTDIPVARTKEPEKRRLGFT